MQINTRLLPFVITAVIEMIGEATANALFIQVTKPLLMPALALWWYYSTSISNVPWRKSVLGALVCSTLGDILLLKAGEFPLFFILGLAAFLIAHLFYIRTYFTIIAGRRGFFQAHPWVIAFFVAYLVALLLWLWPGIPQDMKAPVTAYALIITAMAGWALQLRGIVPEYSANWIFLGAFLFVLSDSLIAVNKFGHPFPEARIAIMGTYIFGQYAIIKGLIGVEST